MDNRIANTEIYNMFLDALENKQHILHKIAKKINNKKLENYYKEYFSPFVSRYGDGFEGYEWTKFLDTKFQSFFSTKTYSGEARYDKKQKLYRIEKYYFGSESFGVLEDNIGDFYFIKTPEAYDRNEMYSYWSDYEKIEYSRTPDSSKSFYENNGGNLYLGKYGVLINDRISDFLFNNENNIHRLFSNIFGSTILKTSGYSVDNNYNVSSGQIYNLSKAFKNIDLDTNLLHNFYGFDILTILENDLIVYNKHKDSTKQVIETIYGKFMVNISNILTNLLGYNISDENILEIWKYVEFSKYAETYNLYTMGNKPEIYNYIDFVNNILATDKLSNNPTFLINEYLNKFNSISLSDLTDNIYREFLNITETIDRTSLIGIIEADGHSGIGHEKTVRKYRGLGFYGYQSLLRNHEYFVEIFSGITEELICKKYNMSDIKEIKMYIYQIQLNDTKYYINNRHIDKGSLVYLLEEQGSFLKIKQINIFNNHIVFYKDNGFVFRIDCNNLDIENSYTSGISTTSENNGISMTGSMKLSKLEITKKGDLKIFLSNQKFRIDTDNVQLKI